MFSRLVYINIVMLICLFSKANIQASPTSSDGLLADDELTLLTLTDWSKPSISNDLPQFYYSTGDDISSFYHNIKITDDSNDGKVIIAVYNTSLNIDQLEAVANSNITLDNITLDSGLQSININNLLITSNQTPELSLRSQGGSINIAHIIASPDALASVKLDVSDESNFSTFILKNADIEANNSTINADTLLFDGITISDVANTSDLTLNIAKEVILSKVNIPSDSFKININSTSNAINLTVSGSSMSIFDNITAEEGLVYNTVKISDITIDRSEGAYLSVSSKQLILSDIIFEGIDALDLNSGDITFEGQITLNSSTIDIQNNDGALLINISDGAYIKLMGTSSLTVNTYQNISDIPDSNIASSINARLDLTENSTATFQQIRWTSLSTINLNNGSILNLYDGNIVNSNINVDDSTVNISALCQRANGDCTAIFDNNEAPAYAGDLITKIELNNDSTLNIGLNDGYCSGYSNNSNCEDRHNLSVERDAEDGGYIIESLVSYSSTLNIYKNTGVIINRYEGFENSAIVINEGAKLDIRYDRDTYNFDETSEDYQVSNIVEIKINNVDNNGVLSIDGGSRSYFDVYIDQYKGYDNAEQISDLRINSSYVELNMFHGESSDASGGNLTIENDSVVDLTGDSYNINKLEISRDAILQVNKNTKVNVEELDLSHDGLIVVNMDYRNTNPSNGDAQITINDTLGCSNESCVIAMNRGSNGIKPTVRIQDADDRDDRSRDVNDESGYTILTATAASSIDFTKADIIITGYSDLFFDYTTHMSIKNIKVDVVRVNTYSSVADGTYQGFAGALDSLLQSDAYFSPDRFDYIAEFLDYLDNVQTKGDLNTLLREHSLVNRRYMLEMNHFMTSNIISTDAYNERFEFVTREYGFIPYMRALYSVKSISGVDGELGVDLRSSTWSLGFDFVGYRNLSYGANISYISSDIDSSESIYDGSFTGTNIDLYLKYLFKTWSINFTSSALIGEYDITRQTPVIDDLRYEYTLYGYDGFNVKEDEYFNKSKSHSQKAYSIALTLSLFKNDEISDNIDNYIYDTGNYILKFKPFMLMSYYFDYFDEFDEKGNALVRLHSDSYYYSSALAELGIKLDNRFVIVGQGFIGGYISGSVRANLVSSFNGGSEQSILQDGDSSSTYDSSNFKPADGQLSPFEVKLQTGLLYNLHSKFTFRALVNMVTSFDTNTYSMGISARYLL